MSFVRSGVGRLSTVLAALAAAGFLSTAPATASSTDTDGDRMPNRWEVAHNLNPRVANARGDADHDGLIDLDEAVAAE